MGTFTMVRKSLLCPACGVLMAEVESRLFPPVFEVRSLDGRSVTPFAGSLLQRIAEQEMARTTGPALQDATARRDFVKRNSAELIYDVPCPNGHSILRTRPQIADAMRRTAGSWVSLR